jgi:hypothetical protein
MGKRRDGDYGIGMEDEDGKREAAAWKWSRGKLVLGKGR